MVAVICILSVLTPGPLGAEPAQRSDSKPHGLHASRSGWSLPGPQAPHITAFGVGKKTVMATGHGKPPRRMLGSRARMMARRAAEVVAVRNLARKLGHGHRGRFRIRGFRYTHTAYHADGSVTVTVEFSKP